MATIWTGFYGSRVKEEFAVSFLLCHKQEGGPESTGGSSNANTKPGIEGQIEQGIRSISLDREEQR